MKYLIVGLGNPGETYQHTRHNIGFDILDALAEASNISFMDKRYGFVSNFSYRGRQIHLLKPSTYVNRSGRAVVYWLKKLKLETDRLMVIYDDLALPFGTMRLRAKGGAGGHNGMEDIITMLGHQNFPRLRFGIGNEFSRGQQIDFVLSNWNSEESKQLPPLIDKAQDIVKSFVFRGITSTMNTYN